MSENSAIEWCDHTFNPWMGCTKVGPGCDHCYAETLMDTRYGKVHWGVGQPRLRTAPANWAKPLAWQKKAPAFLLSHGRRQRVFCASLADWLDNAVDVAWLADLLDLIRTTPDLDWLLLTKRIGNWRSRLEAVAELTVGRRMALNQWVTQWLFAQTPPPQVWLGITAVTQEELDRDGGKLDRTPAAIRFLSMEPLLERAVPTWEYLWGSGSHNGIDWVICGGESGPGARPMHPDWARGLRDQCAAAGVPFLFKQWGEWTPGENVERVRGTVDTAFWDDGWSIYPLNLATDGGHIDDQPDLYHVGKKAAGRLLDGVQHDGFPA